MREQKLIEALKEIAEYILPVYTDLDGNQRVPLENAHYLRSIARKALNLDDTLPGKLL